ALNDIKTQRGGLSRHAVLYLDRVYGRRPRWFKSAQALLDRAEPNSDASGRAWGMPSLDIPPALLHWHLAELFLRRKDLKRTEEELDDAARADPGLARAGLTRAELLWTEGRRPEALALAARLEKDAGADAMLRQDARALAAAMEAP
ncbi:MAG: hypothetical protein KGL53_13130, partial [Elusimicrobia bacterium]|nr:hypothetical protein [Elusimicrobiota bacterium]